MERNEFSRTEKKLINETIHRANFRFDDLSDGARQAKKVLIKCQKLSEIINQQVSDAATEMPKSEIDKI